uniref:hypothetical protein n=1 Tax=Pulvinaster venetus TaxID=427767 RepID=UPI001FCD746D|nr:hypothetical protein MW436_pgp114 [Pulvinaster venetus]UNJ16945.1 hypothetical protein [Pulvinaster venetus]
MNIIKQMTLWSIFILSDGSLTRQLNIITKSRIKLSYPKISNLEILDFVNWNYAEKFKISREIYLVNQKQDKLVYSISLWSNEDKDLISINIPIGHYLIQQKVDFYKDIQTIELVHSNYFEQIFARQGPFWLRSYLLYEKYEIKAIFYEILSPIIMDYF